VNKLSFKILKKDSKTKARLGVLRTSHGTVRTPSYVMVATHAKIKALESSDIKKTKTQIVIANTYHLWDPALLEKSGTSDKKSFVLRRLGTTLPTMTDSGGFQVFSFGAAKEHNVGKVLARGKRKPGEKSAIRITEKGVYFTLDGQKRFLGPELSIEIQEKLGADIIFAFDECTSPLHSFAYNKQAVERTHRWAVRCLKAFHKVKTLDEIGGGRSEQSRQQGRSERGRKGASAAQSRSEVGQLLFGIVQGGRSPRLRKQSAKYIGSLPFGGFGIGGSFGENEMGDTLKTVVPHLPEEKPRHLLGIGRIKDIFIAVENGIDLLDCVIPTREARHGRLWTNKGAYDIRKGKYRNNKYSLETGCGCPACKKITRSQLHAWFKTKNPLAGRYASIHNIWFFNTLLDKIRASLVTGRFNQFKQRYLARLSSLQ